MSRRRSAGSRRVPGGPRPTVPGEWGRALEPPSIGEFGAWTGRASERRAQQCSSGRCHGPFDRRGLRLLARSRTHSRQRGLRFARGASRPARHRPDPGRGPTDGGIARGLAECRERRPRVCRTPGQGHPSRSADRDCAAPRRSPGARKAALAHPPHRFRGDRHPRRTVAVHSVGLPGRDGCPARTAALSRLGDAVRLPLDRTSRGTRDRSSRRLSARGSDLCNAGGSLGGHGIGIGGDPGAAAGRRHAVAARARVVPPLSLACRSRPRGHRAPHERGHPHREGALFRR